MSREGQVRENNECKASKDEMKSFTKARLQHM